MSKAIIEKKAQVPDEPQGPNVPDILRDSTDDYIKKLSNELAIN